VVDLVAACLRLRIKSSAYVTYAFGVCLSKIQGKPR
jgi:hypothetical protein